jgi:hypothetical protein
MASVIETHSSHHVGAVSERSLRHADQHTLQKSALFGQQIDSNIVDTA